MEQVLYPLRDGWSYTELAALCKFENGDRGKNYPSRDAFVEAGIPVINAGNLDGRKIVEAGLNYITRERYDILGSGKVRQGDLLFCLRGSLGKCAIVSNLSEGAIASSLVIVRPSESLDPNYLLYYFNSSLCSAFIERYNNGAAQPNLSAKSLSKFLIPLASLEEQKRIVEKLDALLTRIDTAIEHLQESITLADSLFESSQSEIFNDVLTKYQHSTIDEICTVTSSKRIFKADYVESGIPFYRTKEIVDLSKERDLSTELFIDKDMYLEISDKFGVPKKGDLLFSAVGTIGVMWIVDEREFYFKDGNLLWLKDMNGVIPEYLKSAISAVLTEKIKDRSQGAAYKAISITNLKAFEIPLPSIEEQKLTVAKIEHISSLTKKTKQEIRLQINDLQKLKASILDSAFKGEL